MRGASGESSTEVVYGVLSWTHEIPVIQEPAEDVLAVDLALQEMPG